MAGGADVFFVGTEELDVKAATTAISPSFPLGALSHPGRGLELASAFPEFRLATCISLCSLVEASIPVR